MSRRLDELIKEGHLSPVPVILGPRDQKNRRLFWTVEFEEWARQICATHRSRTLASASEQLNIMFADLISGRSLTSGLARCDPPRGEGIWRLKTPDFRLYGWALEPHTMILAFGELKSVLKKPGPPRDVDYGRKTVATRKSLLLEHKLGERYELFPAIN
jgi:hypothetical protein